MRVPTQEVGVPTYQYACKQPACGHRFEAVQSFSDDPLTSCPVCEGQVRKVFSAVGVVFKGSGFYRNDSREAAKSSAGAAKNGASKDGADSGSGSGEKKAESGEKKAESASASSSSGTGSSAGAGSSAGSGSSGSPSGSTSSAAAS